MRRITKIGIIAGITGISAMAVRCIKAKAFDNGFRTAVKVTGKLVEESFALVEEDVKALKKKYNDLVDNYNELANDYCELLDTAEVEVDEDSEE